LRHHDGPGSFLGLAALGQQGTGAELAGQAVNINPHLDSANPVLGD